MAAAGIGAGGGEDHDLPLEEVDAVLASFSGDPAAAFAPLPAPEAAASREPVVVAGESLREGLGDVEKFLMQDYEDEAPLDGVDEFLNGILVGDSEGEGSPKLTGEKSADRACAGEDEVVVGVDCGDDSNSQKKWRYWSFFSCLFLLEEKTI